MLAMNMAESATKWPEERLVQIRGICLRLSCWCTVAAKAIELRAEATAVRLWHGHRQSPKFKRSNLSRVMYSTGQGHEFECQDRIAELR